MKGIGFDFDHTLGVDNKLERRALNDVLATENFQEGVTREACDDAVEEALRCFRSGNETLDGALFDLFARVLISTYDPAELVARFRAHAVAVADEHVKARPGVADLFARLRAAGIPTAILTNGWSPLQEKKLEIVGYAGPVLVSESLGFQKPDPRAFAVLAETLGLPPEEVLYVGDAPAIDIAGALGAGMSACWYDWEGHVYDERLPKPTFIVHDLSEIPELVLEASAAR